jgi:hypothetical protein
MINVELVASWITALGFFTRLYTERSQTSEKADPHGLAAA